MGVLDGYRGYLVRDGYTGYQQFETTLAGVRQCCQHVLRRLAGVAVLEPGGVQNWTNDVRRALTDAHTAVQQAKARSQQAVDPQLLAELRGRYDKAVESGRIHNRLRDWPDGNHPGYTLALATPWPCGFTGTPSRSGCSPQCSRCRGRTMAVNSPSKI